MPNTYIYSTDGELLHASDAVFTLDMSEGESPGHAYTNACRELMETASIELNFDQRGRHKLKAMFERAERTLAGNRHERRAWKHRRKSKPNATRWPSG